MILYLRCAMTESVLPKHLIACFPNHTTILIECSVTINVSKVLNLEFDWETLKDAPYLVPS